MTVTASRPPVIAAGADRGSAAAAGADRGSGTVLVLAVVAVLALVGAASVALGRAAVARHHAETAADLAALAAADVLVGRAAGDPCERAARTARRNGASLVACASPDGSTVSVEVLVALEGPVGRLGPATARARAGPSEAGSP